MIQRKFVSNPVILRNKQTLLKKTPRSSSNWSLFTIHDASEDSGQSSGTDIEDTIEDEEEKHKQAVPAETIKIQSHETVNESVAKFKHMQLFENVHKELKLVLSHTNSYQRKFFKESKQSHLGREIKLPYHDITSSKVWEVTFVSL